MSGCAACNGLPEPFRQRHPDELRALLRDLQARLRRGSLRDEPDNFAKPVSAVDANGPWSDFVGSVVRCVTCGAAYSLAVDTYHGNGTWKRA